MNGTQICVSLPGKSNSNTNASSSYPIMTTDVAAVPTNVAEKVNPRCGQYYQAVKGDYCNLVIMKYGISLDDFLFLNKAVNANCTNLLADESYCVRPVGDRTSFSKLGILSRADVL